MPGCRFAVQLDLFIPNFLPLTAAPFSKATIGYYPTPHVQGRPLTAISIDVETVAAHLNKMKWQPETKVLSV